MSSGSMMRDASMDFPGESNGEESVIDRSSAFDGVLRTSRNLRVEGQVKGELYCDGTLYIEEGGGVAARVVAANVAIAGELTGEVTCRGRLHILPTGRVSARVATASLAIQEGAIYEGELRMSNLDEEPAHGEAAPPIEVTSGTGSTTPAEAAPFATGQSTATYRANTGRRDRRGDEREEEGRAEAAPVSGEPEDKR